MLHELPFYEELCIAKISEAFKRYARSYKVEIVDSKDTLTTLEAKKSSINLDEIKGFKYQITVNVLLKKHKGNGGTEYVLVYSNFLILPLKQ